MFFRDDRPYNSATDAPDMGSIVKFNGSYFGLISDENKLPKYVQSGTKALLVSDNATKVLVFEKTTNKWYEVK